MACEPTTAAANWQHTHAHIHMHMLMNACVCVCVCVCIDVSVGGRRKPTNTQLPINSGHVCDSPT